MISTTTTTTAPRRSSFATTRTTRTGPFDLEIPSRARACPRGSPPSPGLRRRGGSAGVPRRATRGGGHDQRAAKRAEIESFEYYPGDSAVYREWLGKQPIHRNYDRWLLIFFVGLAVGLMARVLYTIMHTLSDLKYATLRHLLNRRQVFLAWLFNTVYSSALAFAAAYPVAHIAPGPGAAASPR